MKYKLSNETKDFNGKTLYRIIACKDIKAPCINIKKGGRGGWVENETNLSQGGSCWLANEAIACDDSKIIDDAIVKGHAILRGNAEVSGSALVCDYAQIRDNARITAEAKVCGASIVKDQAVVWTKAEVKNNAAIFGKSFIFGKVSGNAHVGGTSIIYGTVSDFASLTGSITIDKDSEVCEKSFLDGEMFLNKTKIASTSPRNLCSNFFTNEEPISFLSSENITPASPNIYIAPINFMREEGQCFLTRGNLTVSCADSLYSSYPVFENIAATSGAGLIKRVCSAMPPDFNVLKEKYNFFPQIYNFIKKLYDNDYRLLADIFISKIKNINDCYFHISDMPIEKEKELLLNLAQNYIFAQFIGIMFWAYKPYEKSNKCSEWFNFLDNFINHCRLDFSAKEIIGISSDTVFWNEEMVRMVAHVCGFSVLWQNKQCGILSESRPTVKLFH